MLVEIGILLLAIPTGYLIAWLARDEIVEGKFWFRVLIILSIVVGLWFYLTGQRYITWTTGFILIVSLISFVKSSDTEAD